MLNARDLKFFALGTVIVASGLSVLAAVNIPNTFTPNTPIKADEVNANFSSLKASIEALQASSGTIADGAITSSKLADGAVLTGKLSTQNAASSGKFLSFNGSSLVWSDGTAGTVGPQGPKGDAGTTGPIGPKGDAGAIGATGAAGVSGYERVIKSLPNLQLAAGSSRQEQVSCPAGKKAIGSGWLVFNGTGGPLFNASDSPLNDTTWLFAFNNTTSANFTANPLQLTVICVAAL